MTAGDVADLIGPAMLVVLCLIVLVVVGLTVAFILHEVKWARRERSIRVGGPALRTLADRLSQYQIEPDNHDHINLIRKENP